MRKTIFFAIFTLCITTISAQAYSSVADSLRKNGIKRLVKIELQEVDSVYFFKKPKIREGTPMQWRAAFDYEGDATFKFNFDGRLVDVFADMLYVPRVYVKPQGNVPQIFVRCTVGLRKMECNTSYLLHVIYFLERYYNCKLEKVRDSLDVFVIHKEFPRKLNQFHSREDEWRDTSGRLVGQQYISQLEGSDLATLTDRMTREYQEIFVLAEEDKGDTNAYYLTLESDDSDYELKKIDRVYREMEDNGLRLTKEKRMIDFYRVTFF